MRRCISAAVAFAFSSLTAPAQLTLEENAHEIVVTSSTPPTWRAVFATGRQASNAVPGGGTLRALHIPASAPESLVGTEPGKFCCAGWGLDHLEWRYIDQGKGVRAPIGTSATIESLEISERSSKRIVLELTGRWRNVPQFTRTIEINPTGYRVRLTADWAGPTDKRGMWWLISLFRGDRLDPGGLKIADANTTAVALPVAKEKVASLPEGIEFPYTVTFPLRGAAVSALQLRVNLFGTDQPEARRYELWPEQDGFVMFYPRFVRAPLEQRRYVFDYEWRFTPDA